MKQFVDLKLLLNNIEDLRLIEPNVFLSPFLEVIRSEETTGQITSLALSALNKFLSYGLIGELCVIDLFKPMVSGDIFFCCASKIRNWVKSMIL